MRCGLSWLLCWGGAGWGISDDWMAVVIKCLRRRLGRVLVGFIHIGMLMLWEGSSWLYSDSVDGTENGGYVTV
jgi:hypothetical protein